MAEWSKTQLSDILVDKGYIRGPFGSALKRGDMKDNGVPVYEQQHAIYDSRCFRYYIDEQKFVEMKRFQVNTDDLIISCSGTVGKVSIIRDDDPKGIISQALLLLRVDKNKILPLYLKYFFSSRDGYNAIVSRSSGSVQVNIAKRDVIEQIPLMLPKIETQRKIVGVLNSIDKKIEENERINNNLLEQVLTLYRNKFVNTANNQRATCRADEYFDISIGKTPPRKEPQWFSTNSQDVTWVSISDMGTCGLYISSSSEQLTKQAVERHNVKVVPDNTVLLSFKLTVGRIAITNGEMTTNEAIAHFKTDKKEIDAKYYAHTTQKQYDVNTLHSGNLYQIFTYVKNLDTGNTGNVSGMLLYAKTDELVLPNNNYKMGGNAISVKTLNLDCDFAEIRRQLDEIVHSCFGFE